MTTEVKDNQNKSNVRIYLFLGIDFIDFMGLASQLAEHQDVARKCAILWPVIKLYQDSFTAVEKVGHGGKGCD